MSPTNTPERALATLALGKGYEFTDSEAVQAEAERMRERMMSKLLGNPVLRRLRHEPEGQS